MLVSTEGWQTSTFYSYYHDLSRQYNKVMYVVDVLWIPRSPACSPGSLACQGWSSSTPCGSLDRFRGRLGGWDEKVRTHISVYREQVALKASVWAPRWEEGGNRETWKAALGIGTTVSCILGRVTAWRERVGEFLQTHTHKCLKQLHQKHLLLHNFWSVPHRGHRTPDNILGPYPC